MRIKSKIFCFFLRLGCIVSAVDYLKEHCNVRVGYAYFPSCYPQEFETDKENQFLLINLSFLLYPTLIVYVTVFHFQPTTSENHLRRKTNS